MHCRAASARELRPRSSAAAVAAEGRTVVVATHNLNLAARYADSLLLLHKGRVAAHGDAHAVVQRQVIESVYGWPVDIFEHQGPGFDRGMPQVAPLSRT